MQVHLPYGERGIDAELPDSATVLVPARTPAFADPLVAVRAAIAAPVVGPPLAALAVAGQRVAIVVSDITRPVPNALILPPILETLEAAGVRPDDITIIIGTGLHRVSRVDEHQRILGAEIAARYRVVDHDARDRSAQRFLLTTPRGVDVWVQRDYMDADLRILTGFVEPHLFAGYSGGAKAMMPGICGAEAIMANHDARMIGHPNATWCSTDGNPIFEEMRDIALKSSPSFTVNVTLDAEKRITGVFAGELVDAHDAAIAQAAQQSQSAIPHRYDIVIVTNMGYPADLVLYQSIKGVSVAAQACVSGGTILLVAECREGVGASEYIEMLHSERSPAALLHNIEGSSETVFDQWQIQVQTMVQARCDVWLHSSLDQPTTESAHLRYAADVQRALAGISDAARTELGREPTLCVMPYGQLTVPVLA